MPYSDIPRKLNLILCMETLNINKEINLQHRVIIKANLY